MSVAEKVKLFEYSTTKEQYEDALKVLSSLDSVMDESIEESIQRYVSYRVNVEKRNKDTDIYSSTDFNQDSNSILTQKFLIDCLNIIIENYVGFAPMCQVLSEWIGILDEAPDLSNDDHKLPINNASMQLKNNPKKKIRIQKSKNTNVNNFLNNNMVEPIALLIERYFNAETLRKYMDDNRDLLGQGGWQPPPCYWSLMKHPAVVNSIQKLFTRNRKSEFLLAFLQDLHNFSKINPNIDCLPKNISFSSTSNFSVFTKNVTELLASFLLTDETIEAALQGVNLLPLSGTMSNPLLSLTYKDDLSTYITSNIVQDICSTFSQSENAYFYAQALLHYMIIWRGDYSGCRRLSQMLYHYVRVTLREPRVAQLNLLFTNLTNFPELFKLCKTIFKMDASSEERGSAMGGLGGFESAVKFSMNPNQISTLHDILKGIVERFESLQMLLYERERINKCIENDALSDQIYPKNDLKKKNKFLENNSAQNETVNNSREWASLGSLQFSLKDLELNMLSKQLPSESKSYLNSSIQSGNTCEEQFFELNSVQKRNIDNSSCCNQNGQASQKIETKFSNCDVYSNDETIFDMPSVSRMGDIPGSDEIQRLKIGPERPPMDALRESALLDTLIDILASQNIWLTAEEQSKTIDLLLLLSVYSPYELLLFLEEQKEWNLTSKEFGSHMNGINNDIWSNSEDEVEGLKIKQSLDTLSDFISSGSDSDSEHEILTGSEISLNNGNNCSQQSKNIADISDRNKQKSNSPLLFEKKQADSIVGCKSTIDSCIYRNVHTQKILGSIQLLSKSKAKKMKEQFQSLRDLCDRFKNRARKELFRIYNIIHDNLIKDDLRWAYLDHLITTPIGASTVLRYIEIFLFSKLNGNSPLLLLSSPIIVVAKHIIQWHPKKRICVFHLLRLCLEHDLHDSGSNTCSIKSLATTKSEKRKWIVDFFVYLVGGGLYGAVLAYMSQVGIRYLDKTLVRDFTIKLSEFCGPPYSIEFSISYLEFLVNSHILGALDLSLFCDGNLTSSSHRVKISIIEIVTILEYIESTSVQQGSLELRSNINRTNETFHWKHNIQYIMEKCKILRQILGKSTNKQVFRGKGLGKAWYQTY